MLMPTRCSRDEPECRAFSPPNPALATLEAAKLSLDLVEGLEARLTTLRDGVVDIPTAEAAVERTQVRGWSVTFVLLISGGCFQFSFSFFPFNYKVFHYFCSDNKYIIISMLMNDLTD